MLLMSLQQKSMHSHHISQQQYIPKKVIYLFAFKAFLLILRYQVQLKAFKTLVIDYNITKTSFHGQLDRFIFSFSHVRFNPISMIVGQLVIFYMGNTHCCEDYKQKDYTSQVPDYPIAQHHFKSESSSPFKANNNNPNNQSASKIKDEGRSSSHRGNENTSQKPIPVQFVESERITVPELHPFIRQKIKVKNYFQGKEPNKCYLKRYGEDVYQGQLDNDDKYPHGFGKMYKSDGSLYIGHFEKGKAEGQGVFLMPDEVVYLGHFHNNYAQGQGKYEWKDVTYQGEFLKNKFHGFGKESSKDYQFQGEYYEGNKNHGLFKWKDAQGYDYMYKGAFNFKNQFHGEGVLAEPSGTYTGDFVDGIKQGKGIYKYTNGLRYEGDYVKGKKQGTGIIYNYNNSIAYEGEFDNDMPHGKGFIYGKQGEKIASNWVKGIDSTYL